jgi:uncharacterized protein
MKLNFRLPFWLTVFWLFSQGATAQEKQSNTPENPRTLLWKVTKPGLAKPSYLLGINHVVSANWLYTFPEIKEVINSSEILLTEMYGDNDRAIFGNTQERDQQNRSSVNIKAVDLLTKEQYATLDSFFVAKVGEGITNNPEAQAMNVWELCSGIMTTLLNDKSKQGVPLPCMDRELYQLFKSKQKPTVGIDNIENLEFKAQDKEEARKILAKFVEATKLSDYAGWSLSDTSYTAGKFVHDYKLMNFDYKLREEDPEKASLIGSHTNLERNYAWLPLIESAVAQHSSLIAVGALHLWYQTGLIALLRERGYTVTAVPIQKVSGNSQLGK